MTVRGTSRRTPTPASSPRPSLVPRRTRSAAAAALRAWPRGPRGLGSGLSSDGSCLPSDLLGDQVRLRSHTPCAGTRLEERQLGGMELVLYDERPVLDPPERLSGAERG